MELATEASGKNQR